MSRRIVLKQKKKLKILRMNTSIIVNEGRRYDLQNQIFTVKSNYNIKTLFSELYSDPRLLSLLQSGRLKRWR